MLLDFGAVIGDGLDLVSCAGDGPSEEKAFHTAVTDGGETQTVVRFPVDLRERERLVEQVDEQRRAIRSLDRKPSLRANAPPYRAGPCGHRLERLGKQLGIASCGDLEAEVRGMLDQSVRHAFPVYPAPLFSYLTVTGQEEFRNRPRMESSSPQPKDMAGAALTAYRTLSPLMPGLLRLLSPRFASLEKFTALRQGLFSDIERKLAAVPKPAYRLWVHSASVGEFEQARPVITELKRKVPGLDVVVSFLSDSGYEARKDFHDAAAVFYLPLDTPGNARRFVGLVRPDLFMLMRYDFWPNHLMAIRQSGAKMVLAAAALPPGSAYFNPLLKGFYRELFALFDNIFTVGRRDREAFETVFGCRHVEHAGDPRFDQVFERQRNSDERAARLKPRFRDRQVLVAGSTWEPDEAVLLPAWLPFREKLSLVLVPHKVDRPNIDRIMALLRSQGLEAVTISSMDESFDPKTQVLVVDQTGYLAELYTIASIAWVGGAFGINVHNTIEPAVHGIPVLFGPNHRKSPEAGDLIEAGGATVISGEADLRLALGRFIDDPKFMRSAGKRAGAFVQSRLGATRIIAEALRSSI